MIKLILRGNELEQRQGLIATIAGDIMFLTAGVLAVWLVHRIAAGIDRAKAAAG